MQQLIEAFPKQLKEALEIGRKAQLKAPGGPYANVVVTGLGGSGIGGRIAAQLLHKEAKEEGAPAHGGGGAKAEVGAMQPLETFIANLSDEEGKRYLKATLQIRVHLIPFAPGRWVGLGLSTAALELVDQQGLEVRPP